MTRSPGRWLACSALLLLAAQNAWAGADPDTPAQKNPDVAGSSELEILVVTGTKTGGGEFGSKSGIALAEMPQSVQVVRGVDAASHSVADVLRAVPSANVGNPRTAPYQSSSLRIRGFLADQLRNGVRQRYYEDVDASALSNVERIEVLKGPSAVLFGQSGQGGIVSLVTKRPQREFASSASGELGSYGGRLARFDLTGTVLAEPGLFFRATGELERSGTFVDDQDLDRENFALSLTAEFSPEVTGYLVGEWIARRTQYNPGLPLVGTVLPYRGGDLPIGRFLSEPDLSHLDASAPLLQGWLDLELAPAWRLKPRVSYSGFRTDFVQIGVGGLLEDGIRVNRAGRSGEQDDTYWIGQLDLEGELGAFGVSHRLLGGIEYSRERGAFLQRRLTNVGPIDPRRPEYQFRRTAPQFEFDFDRHYATDGAAAYAQDLLQLGDSWNLVLGARYSWFRSRTTGTERPADPPPLNPPSSGAWSRVGGLAVQVGSSYQLGAGWSVYGGFNTGFDVENTASALSASGAPLEPERSDQFEAGVRFAGERISASLAAFQIRRLNLRTADPDHPEFSVQKGKVRARGVELEGSAELGGGLQLQAGYAWIHSRIVRSDQDDEGSELVDTPRHQANLTLRWAVPGTPLELWGSGNHVGTRWLPAPRLADRVRLPSYAIVDIGASYVFGRTQIDLVLQNLRDRRYFTASRSRFAVFPGEPRRALVRVTQRF
jgi:TonB-dependent siderophore receptor